jgi:6,7-dimethyl-8-ribityllumazine synthase
MSEISSGVAVIEGGLQAQGMCFAIVVSRFNSFVTERLVEGACDTLLRSGASPQDIAIIRTPGAYELPTVAQEVALTGKFDALIALGCLIRGDTIHFDLIASEAAKGLASVGMATRIPVIFGVLTTDTLEQAVNRAGAKAGNKGSEAASSAIEQVNLYRAIATYCSGSTTRSRAESSSF